ncbi:MAG: hypothetical protein IJJ23_03515 [Clostridia bacterium]|nr:hypothetical protein [Clostridia bacterium]
MSRRDDIERDLAAGMSYAEVAERYNTDKRTIRVYDMVRTRSLPHYEPEELEQPPADKTIPELYAMGYTLMDIAAAKGVSDRDVSFELRMAGIIPRHSPGIRLPDEAELKEIEAEFARGDSAKSISQRHGVAEYNVFRFMRHRGVTRGVGGPRTRAQITPEAWDRAAEEYLNGASIHALSLKYRVGAERVKNALVERGVHILTQKEASARSLTAYNKTQR